MAEGFFHDDPGPGLAFLDAIQESHVDQVLHRGREEVGTERKVEETPARPASGFFIQVVGQGPEILQPLNIPWNVVNPWGERLQELLLRWRQRLFQDVPELFLVHGTPGHPE